MSVLWTDYGGSNTITKIETNGGASSIVEAIQDISNADWVNRWEGPTGFNTASTTFAQYPAASQQALMQFMCADGTVARLAIPAPQIGIFLADGVTVDSTMIADLIAACVGTLAAPSGSLATSFLVGILQRRPGTG